jgi:hypothetical protein
VDGASDAFGENFLPSAVIYPPDQHNNPEITISELSEN